MAIVFIYAVLGGMKGITYTQIAQYCVLIFAYTVPAIFISHELTGNPIPQLGLGGNLADGVALLDKLDQICVDLGFAAYTTQKGSTLNMFLLTMSLMIGTAGLPHVITRFFTVPKVRDARSSRRLGAGLHRHPVHHRPGRGRHGAAEPDADHPDRRRGRGRTATSSTARPRPGSPTGKRPAC